MCNAFGYLPQTAIETLPPAGQTISATTAMILSRSLDLHYILHVCGVEFLSITQC